MRPISLGSPFVSFFRWAPPIGGLEDPACSLPLVCVHGLRSEAPHPGVENVRVHGVYIEIGRAVMLVNIKHLLPGFAAVGGHEHPALRVGTERAPQRSFTQTVFGSRG